MIGAETASVAIGVPSPGLTSVSLAWFYSSFFVIDASIGLWRRGVPLVRQHLFIDDKNENKFKHPTTEVVQGLGTPIATNGFRVLGT